MVVVSNAGDVIPMAFFMFEPTSEKSKNVVAVVLQFKDKFQLFPIDILQRSK